MKTTMPDELVQNLVKPAEEALDEMVDAAKTGRTFDDLVAGVFSGAMRGGPDLETTILKLSTLIALAVCRLASMEEKGVPK